MEQSEGRVTIPTNADYVEGMEKIIAPCGVPAVRDCDFHNKCSNTLAGSSNQTFFYTKDEKEVYTGRVFYKIFADGKYAYSFLFSGVTDSTIPIENATPRNTEVTGWKIVGARVGLSQDCDVEIMPTVTDFQALTFDGQMKKSVDKPTLFFSDEVVLDVKKGEYLCLEVSYQGKKIPHHYENNIPAFIKVGDTWQAKHYAVFANMVACNRPVKKTIAFLGDSITQGLGTACNSYSHWNALLAEWLGTDYAFWNLGIGYGRANDAATNGSWLFKAKQSDVVFVCFGVNDIFRVKNVETTKNDLLFIVNALKKAGCKVVLQTIPPFDYAEESKKMWLELNGYIKEELKEKVDLLLDCVPFLEKEGTVGGSKYNPHPDEEGCRVWAEGIYSDVKEFIERVVCKAWL